MFVRVRITGEPKLCEKIATVIERFFEIETRQNFEVGPIANMVLLEKTIFLEVKKANEPC